VLNQNQIPKISNPNQISTQNQNAFPICKSKSKKKITKNKQKSYVSTREFVVSSGARSHLGKSKIKNTKKKGNTDVQFLGTPKQNKNLCYSRIFFS